MSAPADEFDLIVRNSQTLRNQPVASFASLYDAMKTYTAGDLVCDANDNVYLSVVNSNTGNALTDTNFWKSLFGQTFASLDVSGWEFLRGNRADLHLRSKQPGFGQGGLEMTTYRSVNDSGGFNGGGTGNKAMFGFRGLGGMNLSEVEYVRVRIQGFDRDPVGTIQGATSNPLAIDNFFYLNLFIRMGGTQKILTGSYYWGGYVGNPAGLPVDPTLKDITFRASDGIWAMINDNSFGLPNSNGPGAEGTGGNLVGDLTDYGMWLLDDTQADGGVEFGKTAPSLLLNIGDSGNTEFRSVRISEVEFKLSSEMDPRIYKFD